MTTSFSFSSFIRIFVVQAFVQMIQVKKRYRLLHHITHHDVSERRPCNVQASLGYDSGSKQAPANLLLRLLLFALH